MKQLLVAALLMLGMHITAQNAAWNIQKLGQVGYQNDCNDIWGYTTPDAVEYALVGTTAGVSIVDVSDPTQPNKVQFIQGAYSIWRDLKSWSHYAFVTHDNTFAWNTRPDQGLLIIDMDSVNMPNARYKEWNAPIPLPAGGFDTLRTAHNLYIDEKGWCYVFGSNVAKGGALIFDVATDPWNPVFLGMDNFYYLHDGMVRGDTLWGSAVNDGLFTVVDVSDPDSVVLLATKKTPNQVTHNTWISDNNKVLFTTDEINSAFLVAYDVSDLSNITELDRIQASLGTNVIPHNAHVYGQWVVTSYYTAGVQIVDAKYPELLVEVGHYDTSPNFQGNGFYGNWGAYPYFSSGLLVCSDIEEGLYTLDPTYVQAARVYVEVYDSITKAPLSNVEIEFNVTGLSEQTSIDGFARLGTGYDTTDSYELNLTGYVKASGVYTWQPGSFDTLRVAMLNTANIGLEDRDPVQWSVYPNPTTGPLHLNGLDQSDFRALQHFGYRDRPRAY